MKRSTIATLPRWWNTLTRKRPSPGSEIAKSISRSRVNCSSCVSFMSSSAAWRTIFGDSSTWLTGMILPSILIMTGEYVVKKRSDALLSTINLNSGLTFIGRRLQSEQLVRLEALGAFCFVRELQALGMLARTPSPRACSAA